MQQFKRLLGTAEWDGGPGVKAEEAKSPESHSVHRNDLETEDVVGTEKNAECRRVSTEKDARCDLDEHAKAL